MLFRTILRGQKFPAILLITLLCLGCQDAKQNALPPQAPEVIVAKPLKKKIIDWDEYTGRFQAIERVEVRARVSGYLDAIEFKDGQTVEQGQVLFVIDQRPFKIARDKAEAQYELAKKEYDRALDLRKKRAIAQETLDRRAQELQVTRASLDEAQLNFEFTEVKSPIGGRVSRSQIDVGNLITGGSANATLLTTVVSLDPIHFYFEGSESDLLKYIRLDRSGKRPGSDTNPNPVFTKLQDEEDYRHQGHMDFVDNEVDLSTGTIQARAIFPNPQGIIYPGLFGRARLLGSGEYQALLLPDEVIATNQSRKFVMLVGAENRAEMRFVKLGTLRDSGLRVILEGLHENDQVIINGLQRARPGAPVTPVPGAITEADTQTVGG